MKKIRFGIVGTGTIAHRFANAIKNVDGAVLQAVASRSASGAERFGDEFGVPERFGSYLDMALSDSIDIAYIATPHGSHETNAKTFMNNGKAVICEKPIAVNAAQLKRMIACAKRNNVFFTEAMWARLTPGTIKLIELVNGGVLGKVMGIQGSFCYDMHDEPDHHVFDPEQGGGSLLDVGIYGLNFALWYANSKPVQLLAAANIGVSKTDDHCCVTIKYENGAIASLSSATMLEKPNEGYIFGEKGYVYVRRFYAPQEIELHVNGEEVKTIKCPYAGNGFEEQIAHTCDCLRKGKKESDILAHSASLFIMQQMDEIREQIGLVFPADALG